MRKVASLLATCAATIAMIPVAQAQASRSLTDLNQQPLQGGASLAQDGATTQAPSTKDPATPPSSPEVSSAATQDIIVTGTRLQTGATAPTPVTVIGTDQLTAAAPTLISNALNQLPALQTSSRPASTTQSASRDNGANFLNLRGLGTARTLVLLDGRRFVSSSTSGVPDINLFPQDLVSRVEIVTGGASAAYGSDAVSGVVNFVLNKHFEGVRANLRSGISSRGDAGTRLASLTGGTAFAGGAGHIVASVEYFTQDGVGPISGRKVTDGYYGLATNAAGLRYVASPYNRSLAAGGLAASGALNGLQFLDNGTLASFDFGTARTATDQIGGDGHPLNFDLVPKSERINAFARAEYEAGPVTLFAEGSAAQVKNSYDFLTSNLFGSSAATIFSDNAFLSQAVRNQLAAAGNASFTFRRVNLDLPSIHNDNRNRTYRGLIGATVDLGGSFKVDAFYQHGDSRLRTLISDNPNQRNLYAALDAVVNPATGQIVCRSTLQGLDSGCVPINLFGQNNASQAAKNFVLGTSASNTTVKMDNASVAVSGTVLKLPAGDVAIATGVEYRREAGSSTVDAITGATLTNAGLRGFPAALNGTVGGFAFNNPQPLKGAYSVKEVFGEIEVPLLADQPLAHVLSLNGAVRYVDYSTVGGATTWKLGGLYEPFDGLRFRVTRSRDIRAANLGELFTNNYGILTPVTYQGVSGSAFIVRSGNPDLQPEKADDLTVGVVFKPSWLPRSSLSIDYFNFDIKDAITLLTGQQTIDQCAGGAAQACTLINRQASGLLVVRTPYQNVSRAKARGVDIEFNLGFDLAGGTMQVRALGTYLDRLSTQLAGSAVVDRAGDVGASGTPHWTGTFSMNYVVGKTTLFVQERIIGGGKYDVTIPSARFVDGQDGVGAVAYTDVTVRHQIGHDAPRGLELFATVNNLFDRDPPIVPFAPFSVYRSTNPGLYDVLGRYVTIGARLGF